MDLAMSYANQMNHDTSSKKRRDGDIMKEMLQMVRSVVHWLQITIPNYMTYASCMHMSYRVSECNLKLLKLKYSSDFQSKALRIKAQFYHFY